MKFKLLSNHTGHIVSRQPELVNGKLSLSFEKAPQDSTAIFQLTDGTSYYRELNNGACSIEANKITGEIAVSVTIMNGEAISPVWICEGLKVDRLASGEYLALPNDMNLPLEVIKLKQENEDIRSFCKQLDEQISSLRITLEKIMEGHDFT